MTINILVFLAPCCTALATDGRTILERMHKEYADRWYPSIAFVQKTTLVRETGQRDTSTWYESLKGPNLLRIDIGAIYVVGAAAGDSTKPQFWVDAERLVVVRSFALLPPDDLLRLPEVSVLVPRQDGQKRIEIVGDARINNRSDLDPLQG
jgi:hypothetical protein